MKLVKHTVLSLSLLLAFQACSVSIIGDQSAYNIRSYEPLAQSDQIIYSTQDVQNQENLGLFLGTTTQLPELLDPGFINELVVYQKEAQQKVFYVEGQENASPKKILNVKIMNLASRAIETFSLELNNQVVASYKTLLFNPSCECLVLQDTNDHLLFGKLSLGSNVVSLKELINNYNKSESVAFSQDGSKLYWLGVDGAIYYSPTNIFQAKVLYKKAGDFVSIFHLADNDKKVVYANTQNQLKTITLNAAGDGGIVDIVIGEWIDFSDTALQLATLKTFWKSSADGTLIVFNAGEGLYLLNLQTFHAELISPLYLGLNSPLVFNFVDFYRNLSTGKEELLFAQLFLKGNSGNNYIDELRIEQYTDLASSDPVLLRTQQFALRVGLPSDASNFMVMSKADAAVYLALVKSNLTTDITKLDLASGAVTDIYKLKQQANSLKLNANNLVINVRDGAFLSNGEILFELGINSGLLSQISLQ